MIFSPSRPRSIKRHEAQSSAARTPALHRFAFLEITKASPCGGTFLACGVAAGIRGMAVFALRLIEPHRRDASGGTAGCPKCPSVLGWTSSRCDRSLMSSQCERPGSLLKPLAGGKPARRVRVSFTKRALAVVVRCGVVCRSVISPSFGLTRPMRPRFGMSNRRPSSLRSASIPRPQRPCSAFFPCSLRAHSSRDKKALPWPPSTAWRPFGCGPIASGQRPPSRSRWSRPEKRKRTRTWLPSATSPSTATA